MQNFCRSLRGVVFGRLLLWTESSSLGVSERLLPSGAERLAIGDRSACLGEKGLETDPVDDAILLPLGHEYHCGIVRLFLTSLHHNHDALQTDHVLHSGRETYPSVPNRRKAKRINLPQILAAILDAYQDLARNLTPSFHTHARGWADRQLHLPLCRLRICHVVLGSHLCFLGLRKRYHSSIDSTGIVYISIIAGCLPGFLTIILCDILRHRPQVPKHPPHQVPPEWHLDPSLMESLGIPLGVSWFGWTARVDIHRASLAAAITPFAWGNARLFISTMQYLVDTYHGSTVAPASSVNSLARYGLAGAFPLFTIQMYESLGTGWASSLLGFIAVNLSPVP